MVWPTSGVHALLRNRLLLTMTSGAHQTTAIPADFIPNNRLCGGYALLETGDTTEGSVLTDVPLGAGGGWGAVSLVLG
ncbi:MAG: hypothetical protein ACREEK_09455 [Bradyrhizobium sp.]